MGNIVHVMKCIVQQGHLPLCNIIIHGLIWNWSYVLIEHCFAVLTSTATLMSPSTATLTAVKRHIDNV